MYVFSVDREASSGGLQYAVVDMTLNGGLGGLVSANNALLPFCSEKVTIVPHCNKQHFWLIAHGHGDNNFIVWEVNDQGIQQPPDSTAIGTISGSSSVYAIGYLKASLNGNKLAMANYGGRFFELFDFDNTNGNISNVMRIDNPNVRMPMGWNFLPMSSASTLQKHKEPPNSINII